ncbi:DAK2 domain-containing protein, partial [Klebsiella pneumoniae]
AFAAAQAGADRTCQSSKAGAGRASYLNSESLLGNMDPGAHAVAMVFKALAER